MHSCLIGFYMYASLVNYVNLSYTSPMTVESAVYGKCYCIIRYDSLSNGYMQKSCCYTSFPGEGTGLYVWVFFFIGWF